MIDPKDLTELLNLGKSIVVLNYPFLDKFGVSVEFRDSQVIPLKECYRFLFDLSTESINICSPFIEPASLLRYKSILLAKLNSKIKLRLVTRNLGITPVKPIGKFTEFVNELNPNLRENIEFYEYHYTGISGKLLSSIHAKFIVVDDKYAYLGSADIKETSLTKNLEIGVLTGNPEIVEVLSKLFKELIRISIKI
ncbi:MAG: phospholipase D family protein [Archaeoglobaceae archaeon]|nr:phospholipase D family protein [Archaeoglobaceae archaeon]